MATKICFTHEGRDYCLEYTKETVKDMERQGFVASKVLDAPMSMLPELFAGAFRANHKYTNRKIINDIFEKMTDKRALVDTLSQMYAEPISALMEDSEDEGNGIAWTKG